MPEFLLRGLSVTAALALGRSGAVLFAAMIQIQNLSLHRGALPLLEQANLTLHAGWKVGIIGNNGVGKSSLFKLLLGQLHADAGDLLLPADLSIAHMAQEMGASERSALDYVLDGDARLRQIQAQLTAAETAHQATQIGELHAELEAIDGYRAESRAHQLLDGLGFQPVMPSARSTAFPAAGGSGSIWPRR